MIKKAKENIKKYISKHFIFAICFVFISLSIMFFMIVKNFYNVFAIATALLSVVGGIKLLIWKFGSNMFIKETTLSKKHSEFKKSDAYREICLDDSAEAILISCITFVLAMIFQIGFIIIA